MRKSLKKLVFMYLKEVAADGYTDEELKYMADNFAKAYKRLKSARKDFKEEM